MEPEGNMINQQALSTVTLSLSDMNARAIATYIEAYVDEVKKQTAPKPEISEVERVALA